MGVTLYASLKGDFYDQQARSLNPLRRWFHISRHKLVNNLVLKYYKKSMKIVDIGCGNCVWNETHIPVIGIDTNEQMLKHALKSGRITAMYIGDVNRTTIEDNSIDMVIISEVLEHIKKYKRTLQEIKRILKVGGKVIVTVPYDTNLSLWKPLFKIQCLFQGYVFGSQYYKDNCGHVHHFSPEKIAAVLEEGGFEIDEQFHNHYFTIFTIATKV